MTDEITARAADERLQTILKAVVVGARVQDPASLAAGEEHQLALAGCDLVLGRLDRGVRGQLAALLGGL